MFSMFFFRQMNLIYVCFGLAAGCGCCIVSDGDNFQMYMADVKVQRVTPKDSPFARSIYTYYLFLCSLNLEDPFPLISIYFVCLVLSSTHPIQSSVIIRIQPQRNKQTVRYLANKQLRIYVL